MPAKTSRADFEAVFPEIVKDLTGHAAGYGLPKQALDWFEKVRDSTK